MKKIVIVTKHTDSDHSLIELLSSLFPECEVCAVSLDTDDLEACLNTPLSEFRMTHAQRDTCQGNSGRR